MEGEEEDSGRNQGCRWEPQTSALPKLELLLGKVNGGDLHPWLLEIPAATCPSSPSSFPWLPNMALGSKRTHVQPGVSTGGTAHHSQGLSDLGGLWIEDLLNTKSQSSIFVGTMLNAELDSKRLQRVTANGATLCC